MKYRSKRKPAIANEVFGKPAGRLMLGGFGIDPELAGEARDRLAFLVNAEAPIEIRLRTPLTFIVGENGSGKTTLLEALAVRCAIRPGGGASYAETDDERPASVLSRAIIGVRRTHGLFMRADLVQAFANAAGSMRMPHSGEWRPASEQSRGEGMLSLLDAKVDPSEGMLYLLDEPETGLSPQRQLALLRMLDAVHKDGRSQAIVATHSPILLAHPEATILEVTGEGISEVTLENTGHWSVSRAFFRDPQGFMRRLLED